MKIKYNLNELEPVGFWDRCLFYQNNDDSGILFKTPEGERIKLSYSIIKKMEKEAK